MSPIIIMDELITITEQRRTSIANMKDTSALKHKSAFVQQERKRNQRQNWILRVLKTLKIFSSQQKKIIFQTTLRIMNHYQNVQNIGPNYEQINFTETFINLFVEFYNKFQGMDLTHIKTIIRPNNNYIIVDLIKSLIEITRKDFKIALQNQFKELPSVKLQRKFSERVVEIKNQHTGGSLSIRSESKIEEKRRKGQTLEEISRRIDAALYEKYSKAIDHYNLQTVEDRFNELYFGLLYLNNKNAVIIQKYQDSLFGPKRHINYDVSGLYTQAEIKKMNDDQSLRAKNKAADLKQLTGKCSTQHLKEYFKIKIQIHEAQNSISLKQKQISLRPWFPLMMSKNGNRLHPFTQLVEYNKNICLLSDFQEKYNKKIKYYLRQTLLQYYKNRKLDQGSSFSFNKRDYLDVANFKLTELLNKEPCFKKEKQKDKQSFLPPISSSQNLQQPRVRPAKTRSETKLPSANNRLMVPQQKFSENMSQMLQRRMNHSSIFKDGQVSRKNMDNLIDNIIKAKEATFA